MPAKKAIVSGEEMNRLNTADTKGQKTDWETINLPGKWLELIDPVSVQSLRFDADGYVAATIGTKEALAAPIFFWKVKNGILLISDDEDSPAMMELSKPRVSGHPLSTLGQILSVTDENGREIQYKLSQPK